MNTFGARITLWYALGATISFAILSLVGGAFLQTRLIAGLDALNAAEFRLLKTYVGDDYATIGPAELAHRLREVDQYQSVLFYIAIDSPSQKAVVFRSHNLHGEPIPDVKGARVYSAETPRLGALRVGEFLLPPYDLTIGTSARTVRDGARAYLAMASGLCLLMLLISIVVGRRFSRFVLQPIRAIRATAERIGSDNMQDRVPITHMRDEIDELAQLLNSMFDRLEAAFVQIQRFSEEVSHELKTPLALIRLHAEAIVKSGTHSEAALEQIEEINRLTNFIDQMLFLARAEAQAISFDLQPIDPAPFLRGFAGDALALADHAGRRFVLELHGTGTVALDISWLRQVLFNLLSNALRVTGEGGLVRIMSSFAPGCWRIVVEDEGPGLPASECERIFDRFVQLGARAGRGSGLGLAIARGIVKLHGGSIRADPRGDRPGLRVVIELPATVALDPDRIDAEMSIVTND